MHALRTSGYDPIVTSKEVRERCNTRGAPVTRVSIQWILVALRGSNVPGTQLDIDSAAGAVKRFVLQSIAHAGMTLDEAELQLLESWIPGSGEDSGSPPGPADRSDIVGAFDQQPSLHAELESFEH